MSRAGERELLSALLDGELPPEEEARLRELLAVRPDLREELRELEAVVGIVRDIPGETAPEGFRAAVMARLPAARRRPRVFLLVPLAAAATLLLAVYLAGRSRRGTTPPAAPLEVASADGTRAPAAEEKDLGMAGGRVPEESEARPAKGKAAPPARAEAKAARTREDGNRGWREGRVPAAKQGEGGAVQTALPPVAPRAATVLRYRLRGISPDAAAGVVLAELGRLRSEGGECRSRPTAPGQAAGERLAREEVEQDARGEPVALHLRLTVRELAYLRGILGEKEGAVLLVSRGGPAKARAGEGGPPAPATPPAGSARRRPERMPVVIRFLANR